MQTDEQKACSFPLKINVVGINAENKKAIIFNPRCKKWDCPYCGEKNREDWVWRAFRGSRLLVEQGLALRFITVTSRPYATPVQSIHFFKENWPKLVRRASYHTNKIDGEKWHYFLVPEHHKTGVLHAHLIATTYLKSRWWKDNANACGFGYIAESKPVKYTEACAGYVTKYLNKSLKFTMWPKGFRRARTSQAWPKTPVIKDEGWEFATHGDESVWFEKHWLEDAGFIVDDKRAE